MNFQLNRPQPSPQLVKEMARALAEDAGEVDETIFITRAREDQVFSQTFTDVAKEMIVTRQRGNKFTYVVVWK